MWASGLSTSHRAVAAAACSALLILGAPAATAAPDTDDQGFVDSGARCGGPDVAVAFGSTATSRVAICKQPDGLYQYRGVRLSDGATLIVPATDSGGVSYVAQNNGVTYTVTANSLVISVRGQVIRREPMVDFHQPGAPPKRTPMPTTTTPTTPETTTSQTPLPPPLPAEVGGGRG